MLPKFPDKQRRPGIIHLPQPLATPPRPTSKLPALNPSQKQTQTPVQALNVVRKGNPQLRTPSPSPYPDPLPRRQPHSNNNNNNSRRKQKRSSVGNIVTNIPESALVDAEAPLSPLAVVVPRPGLIVLSPPPTPAVRASNKSSKKNAKNKAQNHVRNVSKSIVLPVSPPLTPEAPSFSPVVVQEAVFSLEGHAPDSSDSLPLAEEDEVIVWKHPQTPISAFPAPLQRAPSTSSRTSSPSEFFNWDDVKNLPRLSPATIAQLKEQYDIRPSEAFLQQKNLEPQEPDLLMSLLHSASSSCPPSPGGSQDASTPFSSPSKPIPIARRPGGSHVRAPSVPAYPSSGRLAMMQYNEDVAEAFGLDVRDVMAVRRATEAWRAYAGSAFNNSPEAERVPAPKFLGRLFN
jgi:hypothetical protein